MSKDKNTQEFVAANIKITKGMTQQARELGITHAAYRNKGVQKRLMREQKEIIKRQQRNEGIKRKLIKEFEQDKAAKLKAAKQQQAEKEHLTVLEQVMSVPPEPGPLEDLGYFGDSPRETVEQAAKRVMGIIGFGGLEAAQAGEYDTEGLFLKPNTPSNNNVQAISGSEAYDIIKDNPSNTETAGFTIDSFSPTDNTERIKLKYVDIDVAATYPGPDTTSEELHEASRQVSGWEQGIPEETGIDPTLPFDDGTVDTNVDPKNFGVQSVDDNVDEAELPTNVTRNADGSVIFHDVKTGWRTKLPAHMVDGNKLSRLMDVAELEAIAKYLPLDLSVQIMDKLELAKADGVTQVETPQELVDYWSSCIGNDDVTRMYPDGHQDWKWDDLQKKIAEQGGLSNVTIMAELPTNEPTGRGFPIPPMTVEMLLNPFESHGWGNRKQMFGNSKGQQPRVITEAVVAPELKENQVLVNLYGDENSYKPFPNIGDTIRPDGLLMAVHTVDGEPLSEKDLINLREVDLINDTIAFNKSILMSPVVHTFSHSTVEGVMTMVKEEARKAISEDISQTFPHHPQEDAAFPHRPDHQFDPLLEVVYQSTPEEVAHLVDEAVMGDNKPQALDIATGEIRETTGHVVDGKVQYIDDKSKDDSSDKE